MTDKREEVARAIDDTTIDGYRLRDLPAETAVVDALIQKAAQAAIEAMRVPTEEPAGQLIAKEAHNDALEAAAEEIVKRCIGMRRREIAAAILRLKK